MSRTRCVLVTAALLAGAAANLCSGAGRCRRSSYFSLSSQQTYMPGAKPEVAVYSHKIKQLEFRVYRINDPVKFFSQLQELHSFGGRAPALPKQPHTWLEKFHAWKHSVWAWIRDFVRAQFSVENRHEIRLWRLGEDRAAEEAGSAG